MGTGVVCTALLKCSFGNLPTPFMVLPDKKVLCGNLPAATIMDHKPIVNILPFGMCNNPANPMVAAATAAAMGVLTPMPCIPVTTAPWSPGNPKILIGGQPALASDLKLMCAFGGCIQVNVPGQLTVQYGS